MKYSGLLDIIAGLALFVLAACFAVSLAGAALGFDSIGTALGQMILGAYGFCAVLIPIFLCLAGVVCFLGNWTYRRAVRMMTACVPFFTLVATESTCRSIYVLGQDAFTGAKVGITVALGIMLVIIEYLGVGIIADKLPFAVGGTGEDEAGEATAQKAFRVKDAGHKGKAKYGASNDMLDALDEDGTTHDETLSDDEVADVEAEIASPAKKAAAVNDDAQEAAEDSKTDAVAPVKAVEADDDKTVGQKDVTIADADSSKKAAENRVEPIDVFDHILDKKEIGHIDGGEGAADKDAADKDDTAELHIGSAVITEEEYNALTSDTDMLGHTGEDSAVAMDTTVTDDYAPPVAAPADEKKNGDEEYIAEQFCEVVPVGAASTAEPCRDEYDCVEVAAADRYCDTVCETAREEEPHEDLALMNAADEVGERAMLQDNDERVRGELDPDFFDIDLNDERADIDEDENLDDTVIEPSQSYDVHSDMAERDGEAIDAALDEAVVASVVVPSLNAADNSDGGDDGGTLLRKTADNTPVLIGLADLAQYDRAFSPHSTADVFAQMDADVRRELGIETGAHGEASAAQSAAVDADTEPSAIADATMEMTEAAKAVETEDESCGNDCDAISCESDCYADIEGDATDETMPSVGDVDNRQGAEAASKDAEETVVKVTEDAHDTIGESMAASAPVVSVAHVVPKVVAPTAPIPLVESRIGGMADVRYGVRAKVPYSVPTNLLTAYADDQYWVIDAGTQRASATLKETLGEFKIQAEVVGIMKGPVVTMFELLPAPGVKLSKIVALQDNIALRLAASSVRIVAPIPGKKAVGIEIPNKKRSIVGFRELIEQDAAEYKSMTVPVILGKDILGHPQIIDLVKTPHLLIAGATGAGKSVCVNSMILSILYKRSPQDVKLILIDPKVVELKLYNDIPHLLVPVITETKKALQALQWALCEMERRYSMLDRMGCREIASYNKKIVEKNIAAEKMPYIIIIIDEFADLMATSGKELESTVARLAAMSRAVGIHLALATQRPSIDVITGLIKANIPSRIAFMVASKTDSRIIIDQVGAEKLLGKGDMLYASAIDPYPTRIQGTFVSDQEVENVVDYVKQYDTPDYIEDEVFVSDDDDSISDPSEFGDGEDPLFDDALQIVVTAGKASASYIQRKLKIGYNRAARLVEDMEARGIVGPANGSKPREIVHMP